MKRVLVGAISLWIALASQACLDANIRPFAVVEPPCWKSAVSVSDCARRLRLMQYALLIETKRLQRDVEKGHEAFASRLQESTNWLAEQQGKIARTAEDAARRLHEEEFALAFAGFFQQLRDDATSAQQRLLKCDFGVTTQLLQQEIVDSLDELVRALGVS